MTTIARAVLAALVLAGPTLAAAAVKPTDAGTKPSSYAPRPNTNGHVYGSPIDPPITGHVTASHHTHTHKKHSASATARHAHRAPAHAGEAKAHRQVVGPQPSPRQP
jgi:hypothetical protein